jgi:hypothetical protein
VRSAIISRSNCAKLTTMLRVSRPIASRVLNCWVVETKPTFFSSKQAVGCAKSRSERLKRSTL